MKTQKNTLVKIRRFVLNFCEKAFRLSFGGFSIHINYVSKTDARTEIYIADSNSLLILYEDEV